MQLLLPIKNFPLLLIKMITELSNRLSLVLRFLYVIAGAWQKEISISRTFLLNAFGLLHPPHVLGRGFFISPMPISNLKGFKTPYYQYDQQSLENILSIVSEVTGISIYALKGKRKIAAFAVARQIYYYMAFKYTRNSLESIGKIIAARDRSTVRWGIRAVNDMIDTKFNNVPELVEKIELRVSLLYEAVNRSTVRKFHNRLAV